KFSAGIFQQENISEDIFLPDIILAIRKIENTHCFVCGKRGASISCAQAGCDRSFHLPCASEGECVTQYFDEFRGPLPGNNLCAPRVDRQKRCSASECRYQYGREEAARSG
ncbi:hypothetical protein ASZ78_001172, partial [Callipepla squamata]